MAVVCPAGHPSGREQRGRAQLCSWTRAPRLSQPERTVSRILIGADVGGSKTAVGVADGDQVLARADGAGAAIRPGRALASASVIAEVVRKARSEEHTSELQ